jgi:hypothetical protein
MSGTLKDSRAAAVAGTFEDSRASSVASKFKRTRAAKVLRLEERQVMVGSGRLVLKMCGQKSRTRLIMSEQIGVARVISRRQENW